MRVETLDPSCESKDQHDQKHQTQAAARIVAPAVAVGPSRQRTDQEKHQQHDDDDTHVFSPPFALSKACCSSEFACPRETQRLCHVVHRPAGDRAKPGNSARFGELWRAERSQCGQSAPREVASRWERSTYKNKEHGKELKP